MDDEAGEKGVGVDRFTEERYGALVREDLDEERWPWRGKPATNTPQEVARRRRQMWLAFRGTDEEVADGAGCARLPDVEVA